MSQTSTPTPQDPDLPTKVPHPKTGLFNAAEDRLLAMAEDTKSGLVRSMDGLVLSVHRLAAEIDSVAGAPFGDFARSAADLLGAVQRGLDDKPLAELLDDGQNFIRQRPALTIGVAVASGFLLARLARGTATKADDDA
jgi:hypothetical protein